MLILWISSFQTQLFILAACQDVLGAHFHGFTYYGLKLNIIITDCLIHISDSMVRIANSFIIETPSRVCIFFCCTLNVTQFNDHQSFIPIVILALVFNLTNVIGFTYA